MTPLSRLARHIARPHLPRRTVRLRLTLLYGVLFLISGAALLTVTYFLVRHAVEGQSVRGSDLIPAPGGLPGPADAPPDAGTNPSPPQPGARSFVDVLTVQAQQALLEQKAAVLHQLLVQSGIALGIMAVVATVLGWVVAGRILRRLRTITATARDISANNLHRRLALDGPSDELKELGDTFDELLGRLETSFQAQRRFVANASHELRTPLARQRAIGQVALADPDADVASLRAAHERILAAGTQQERFIEALLTLARGQVGIEVRAPFDLAGLAREVIDAQAAEADYRGLVIRSSISPAMAAGHRPLAERLVTNLVDNAVRHNESGGWLEVRTRTVDGRAVLVVANTGPVAQPDDVDQLFRPFQQLGTARTGEGLGLGLSIVAAVAAAHDATVTAGARPGGGLSVTVTFPSLQPSPHPATRPARNRGRR